MRTLLLVLALLLLVAADLKADDPMHYADVGHFVVKWHLVHSAGGIGDIINIYARTHRTGSAHSGLTRIYMYNGYTFLDSAVSWCPPISIYPSKRGIMLTTSFGSGSGKEFVILAQTKRGFGEVFKAFSDKIGDGRSLEFVDLDGDGYPEIICVPTYGDFRGADPGTTRAQVWKWNDKLERYFKVRDSAYLDRLKPLKPRE